MVSTGLLTLLLAWGIVTAILVVALIYRSALATHEDTQIFLDAAEKSIANEKLAIGAKIDRLGRAITILFIVSGTLLAISAGVWLWQGLRNF